MKKLVLLIGLLAVATWMQADTPATPKPGTPAKPGEKEEPPIPGIVIPRTSGNGDQMGLTILDGGFKLSFYDKKRKHVTADITRALCNWQSKQHDVRDSTVLNPIDDGKALGGGKFVRPPFAFILRITLMKGEGDSEQAAENYSIVVTDDILKTK